MERSYYPTWYRLDSMDGYLIWYSDEQDGVLCSADGKVYGFRDMQTLHQHVQSLNIACDADDMTV